jgi:hypothetical protein
MGYNKKTMLYKIVIILLVKCLLMVPTAFCTENISQWSRIQFDYTTILQKSPTGTPPLPEEEFKYDVKAANPKLLEGNFILNILGNKLASACANPLLWQAPKATGNNYRVGEIGQGSFCFADIYLDTPDLLNLKIKVSYRVRYRWHSTGAFHRFILGSRNPRDLPHRCEFQFKNYNLNEDKISHSHAWALESRFEFRPESQPFKDNPLAPPSPWPLEEFMPYALAGHYSGYTPYPAHEYAKALQEAKTNGLLLSSKIQLEPKAVVVTTRRRIHLVMDNEFGRISAEKGLGSNENYNQAILITLDSSQIYTPELLKIYFLSNNHTNHPWLDKRLRTRLKSQMTHSFLGEFTELEFEFERNILSAINAHGAAAQDLSSLDLEEIKNAFRIDQEQTAKVVKEALSEFNLQITAFSENKYSRAIKFVLPKLKPKAN